MPHLTRANRFQRPESTGTLNSKDYLNQQDILKDYKTAQRRSRTFQERHKATI